MSQSSINLPSPSNGFTAAGPNLIHKIWVFTHSFSKVHKTVSIKGKQWQLLLCQKYFNVNCLIIQ